LLCYRCGTYAPDGSPKCPGCGQIFQKSTNGEKRKSSQTRQPQAIFSVGETVAERYKILDVIGQGGVGTVYRAHDTDIDVEVALKAVAPKLLQTADEQKTFSKFIKTARKLHHANIVRIYDEGRDTGPQGERRFFTMQLLEGLTLRKIIQLRREKSQVFQVAEVEPIFQQLAAAMDYAHKTVWHGDLKPENVLVLPDLLKVTDFCIIQALPTKPFLAIQKSRGAAYHYIAPEVRLEASRIDGRADVYSLGVMLAEMLTGELYEGHANKNYQKALETLPRSLENLIRRATHESSDSRVQSAGELAEGLADIVARGETTRSPDPPAMPRSLPPPPPPSDSGVHDAPNMHVQGEGSIPQLSESSVIMLEHVQQSATDVTLLPDGTPASDETPVVGLKSRRVEAVLELDTDEQRTGAANRSKPPPPPPTDEPASLGPPTHEDTQQDDGPADSADQDLPPIPVGKGANGHAAKGNGSGKKDPYGPPPPLPDDPSDSGRMVSGPDVVSIHDEPTLSEKANKVGIHDQLTSLRPNPNRAQEATLPRGSLIPPSERPTTAMPPSGPAAISVPPPPPREPSHKNNRGTPLLAIFAVIGVVMGAGGFFAYREYSRVRRELDQARQTQPAPNLPLQGTSAQDDPAAAANAAAEEARKKAEADAAAKAAEQEAARKKAEEEANARKLAEEEAARKKAAEDAAKVSPAEEKKRKEEERRAQAEEAKRKKDEEKAAAEEAKRKRDEERLAGSDDKKRKEEERRAQAEEAKRKKDEEMAARAEEKQRRDEERRAQAEEAKKKKEQEQAARAQAEEEKRKAKEEAAAAKKKAEEDAKHKQVASANADPATLSCPKGMALIPGGTFKMGSAANDPMHNFEEKRLESVEVKPFCVDYYEFPNSKAAKPTTSVSWFQAQELCKGKGKRLCEEDEWEKACKGPDNDRYPYGNSWDPDRCNTQDAEGNDRELAEQKAFPKCRSGFGIINLSGNAAEWVASSFSASVKDRVHKGGSANRPDWATRCANRANLAPSGKNPFVGFRCCADPVAGATE
jgi:serine/threonine protein kinase/formylglycine-generating enzyme required for sulfatase activity